MKFLLLFAILTSSYAFLSTVLKKPNVKQSKKLSMVVLDNNYPGQTLPLGYFDPLNLASNVDEKRFKLWRESELKHGRLAMLAAVGILVGEKFNPLFGGRVMGPAIYHFQEILSFWPAFWIVILASVAIIETYNIQLGWETTEEKTTANAMLKDSYIPGDLNFDPLNLAPTNEEAMTEKINKELNNGRLAMIGVAGIIYISYNIILSFIKFYEHVYNRYGCTRACR